MKKSVFALAAMAATGAAQAQSSVSVYGIIDAGYKSVESDTLKYSSSANTNSVITSKVSGITGQGSESTSRFGFRGVEDIGGGLKANFAFEVGMDPAGSTLTPMNTRQAFVGLEKSGVGRLDFGTMYTPHHLTMAAFSPSTLPNVPGAIDYTQSVGSSGLGGTLDKFGVVATGTTLAVATGASMTSGDQTAAVVVVNVALQKAGLNNAALDAAGTGISTAATTGTVMVSFAGSMAASAGYDAAISAAQALLNAKATADLNIRLARGNNTSYTVRNNNTVNYQSPNINGFQAGIAYSLPTQTKVTNDSAGVDTTSSIMMLNAGYSAGKFAAAAAYSAGVATTVTNTAAVTASIQTSQMNSLMSLNYGSAAAAASTTAVATGNRSASAARLATVEVKTVETMGAASYNFGPAKVSYIYTKRTAKDTVSDLSDKTTHNFGVKAPFGATTAFASFTTGSQTILGSTANEAKYDLRGVQAGVSYALSKRTDAYAIYGKSDMDRKANNNDIKDSGYAVGVRHTF